MRRKSDKLLGDREKFSQQLTIPGLEIDVVMGRLWKDLYMAQSRRYCRNEGLGPRPEYDIVSRCNDHEHRCMNILHPMHRII